LRIIPTHTHAACSEFRIEYLNPPYMTMERPQISNVPGKISFNSKFNIDVAIPPGLGKENIKGTCPKSHPDSLYSTTDSCIDGLGVFYACFPFKFAAGLYGSGVVQRWKDTFNC